MNFETHDTNRYGAHETNGLVNGHAYHREVDYSVTYTLREIQDMKGHITRVRILTEKVPGVGMLADISYIHATLRDGRTVPVQNEIQNLTPLRNMKSEMIKWATREGVYAKALGLLDNGNWSVL